MKKLIAILAALLILSASLGALAVPAVNRCTLGPFGFTVPTDMRRVQSGVGDSTRIDYENSSGDTVVCNLATVEVDASDVFGLNLYYTSVVSGIGLQNPVTEIIDIGGHSAMLWRGAYPVQGGSALRASGLVYHRGATSLVVAFYSGHMPEDNLYDCARQIAESITYVGPEEDELVEDEPAADSPTPTDHASAESDPNEDTSAEQIIEIDGFSLSVPNGWQSDVVEENGIVYHRYYANPATIWNGFLRIYTYGFGYDLDVDILGESAYDAYFLNLGGSNTRREFINVCDELAVIWSSNIQYEDAMRPTYGLTLIHGDMMLCVLYVNENSSSDMNLDFVRNISSSVRVPGFTPSGVDLSGMTYDELVALKDQINLAMWNSAEWQEVEVPVGIWHVGEDIPAGHWTIKMPDVKDYAKVVWGTGIDETGTMIKGVISTELIASEQHSFYEEVHISEFDIELVDGLYVGVQSCPVVFTPYTGKPSLGFR